MRVLVTGGAGYIGSHMVKMLVETGAEVVVLDDLSTGFRDAVAGAEFVRGSVGYASLLGMLFGSRRFDAVMHFASASQVGESVALPGRYYRNNVVDALALLDAMVEHRVGRFVFSSSAAVYGEPRATPIGEDHPLEPVNPYGRTKRVLEEALADYQRAHGLAFASLRYFNAAGADPSGRLGERHEPETHLVPLALRVASGRLAALRVYGCDYDTPDGTCIRDYVHVEDLCRAHLLALARLMDGGASGAWNLGNGEGFSVREVLAAARRVTRRPIAALEEARRPGDPARLVADAARARSELGWRPRYPELEAMIAHAWSWERRGQEKAPGRLLRTGT